MLVEVAGYSCKVLLIDHTADLEGAGRSLGGVADKLELAAQLEDIAGTEMLKELGLNMS